MITNFMFSKKKDLYATGYLKLLVLASNNLIGNEKIDRMSKIICLVLNNECLILKFIG